MPEATSPTDIEAYAVKHPREVMEVDLNSNRMEVALNPMPDFVPPGSSPGIPTTPPSGLWNPNCLVEPAGPRKLGLWNPIGLAEPAGPRN